MGQLALVGRRGGADTQQVVKPGTAGYRGRQEQGSYKNKNMDLFHLFLQSKLSWNKGQHNAGVSQRNEVKVEQKHIPAVTFRRYERGEF